MFEVLICSLVTILPDYLVRRYLQGKRFGHEITLYSVWYELRYGITGCALLTLSLITVVFYYHPSAVTVTAPLEVTAVMSLLPVTDVIPPPPPPPVAEIMFFGLKCRILESKVVACY